MKDQPKSLKHYIQWTAEWTILLVTVHWAGVLFAMIMEHIR